MLTEKQVEEIQKLKGSRIVTLVAETDARVKQGTKNNPSPFRGKNVIKRSKVNGLIGNWKYANSVNNQRAREGNQDFFEPQPRKWGERRKGTPFVDHKGKVYLEVKIEKVLEKEYFVDGVKTPNEEVEEYITEKKQAKTQETEKPILIADYNLKNIKEISI